MTLLITVWAAVIATIVWYKNAPQDTMKISSLCFMYWGASLMWFVDAVFEYVRQRAEFFTPDTADLINDTFLGLSVVTFGLVIWVVILLFKNPKGVVQNILVKQK